MRTECDRGLSEGGEPEDLVVKAEAVDSCVAVDELRNPGARVCEDDDDVSWGAYLVPARR